MAERRNSCDPYALTTMVDAVSAMNHLQEPKAMLEAATNKVLLLPPNVVCVRVASRFTRIQDVMREPGVQTLTEEEAVEMVHELQDVLSHLKHCARATH